MLLGRYLADSQPQRRWAGAVHIPVHHRALALALVQNWASQDPRQIIIPLSTGKKGMKASEYKKFGVYLIRLRGHRLGSRSSETVDFGVFWWIFVIFGFCIARWLHPIAVFCRRKLPDRAA